MTEAILHDENAERSIIGATMVDPGVLPLAVEPGDFYLESARYAFEVILSLHEHSQAIDTVTLEAELRRRNQWDAVGLSFLMRCERDLPTASNAASYAAIVRELALKRDVAGITQDLIKSVYCENGRYKHEVEHAIKKLTLIAEELKPATRADRFAVHCDLETLEPTKPLDEIVRGVQAAEQVNVWSGDGGLGKTYCAIDLCVSVAYNKSRWLDFEIANGGPTLVVDMQSGHDRMVRRVREVLAGHEIEPRGAIAWLTFPRFKLVSQPEDADALRAAIRAAGARLVVFDSLLNFVESGSSGNAENDSVAMGNLFAVLRQIACECQCAMILLHHVNRAGGYRGSTAIKDESDGLVILSRADDSDVIHFKSEKSRDYQPFKFAARLNFEPGSFNLSPCDAPADVQRIRPSDEFVLRYLQEHPTATIEEVASNADVCSPRAAQLALYRLVKLGQVYRTNAGGRGVKACYAIRP
jgi:hypothetical protein